MPWPGRGPGRAPGSAAAPVMVVNDSPGAGSQERHDHEVQRRARKPRHPARAARVAAFREQMRDADRTHSMTLAMVRQAAGLTQTEMAEPLHVTQAAVARTEKRGDMLLVDAPLVPGSSRRSRADRRRTGRRHQCRDHPRRGCYLMPGPNAHPAGTWCPQRARQLHARVLPCWVPGCDVPCGVTNQLSVEPPAGL